ncbi:hypothetical protein F2Q69_00017729 [Brassica cretica]|uniref:Uncharacterized protein n=1 Tax=Brassica cretica TaxID=69181 RepID=A0A8S9RA15_BRACR|nr:hypothetical protein F2Q69_00017729 [Brassica cretica]
MGRLNMIIGLEETNQLWCKANRVEEAIQDMDLVLGTPPTKGRNISNAFNTVPVSVLDTLVHPFFDELRDPLMHVSFLPPLFNFKPHELKGVRVPVEIMAKLVPEHAEEAGSMARFVILSAVNLIFFSLGL